MIVNDVCPCFLALSYAQSSSDCELGKSLTLPSPKPHAAEYARCIAMTVICGVVSRGFFTELHTA